MEEFETKVVDHTLSKEEIEMVSGAGSIAELENYVTGFYKKPKVPPVTSISNQQPTHSSIFCG